MSDLKKPTGVINPSNDADEDMHREVDWLVPADKYILEFLTSCSATRGRTRLGPQAIALNLPYGRKHVSNRCRDLAEHGLLEREKRGVYRITDRGEAFLARELSPEDLREADE